VISVAATWTPAHLARLVDDPQTMAPVIRPAEARRMIPSYDLWDPWPVREIDGTPVSAAGGELWMALCAPAMGDPGGRHDVARIRMFVRYTDACRDLGPVFPDGASLGSREWAGCAIVDRAAGTLTVLYTATGRRGEERPTFVQRIVAATAPVSFADDTVEIGAWGPHQEAVPPDPRHYVVVDQLDGEPGFIKAFRDPFHFRDPATGDQYVLFVGSMPDSATSFNGAIGIARHVGTGLERWEPLPPLITADGVNNELERPHVLASGGLYYLFFSTQTRTFHPDVSGPTGLYGFVGPSLFGPWEPIDGSGLVLRNPIEEPAQAYSWLVLPDLRVASFVDAHSLAGARPEDLDPVAARRHFGGTMSPDLHITLDGNRARLVSR
jgi:levansucrase